MGRRPLGEQYLLEGEFRNYLTKRGLDAHTVGSYIANIKNLIDGVIREYLEQNHTSIFDVEDIELVGMYLGEFRNDEELSRINKEKHNHCTAPLKKYYEFLQWKANPSETEFNKKPEKAIVNEPEIPEVKQRSIEEVEAEIATLRKYGFQIPEKLEQEYNDILSANFLKTLPEKLNPVFNSCKQDLNLTILYTPTTGVTIIDNSVKTANEGRQSKRMNLKVTFPDGRVIMGPTAKDTLVATIEALGCERVEALQMLYVNYPMISDKKHEKEVYANCQVEIRPGKYLITASGTEYKKAKLEEVIRRLGEKATVEMIPADEYVEATPILAPEPIKTKAASTRLKVICPDGTIIDEGFASDTMVEAIRIAGPQRVKALGLTCCDVPLVAERFDPEYRNSQKPVSNGLLVMTNNSTEHKKKYLDTISLRLNLGWKVEII